MGQDMLTLLVSLSDVLFYIMIQIMHLSIQSWLFAWSLLAIDIDILHMTTLGVLFSTDQSAKNLSNREVFKTEQTLKSSSSTGQDIYIFSIWLDDER